MSLPILHFNGEAGQPSTDTMGPEQLQADLNELAKMFNPNATLSSGAAGGISKSNLNFEIDADADYSKIPATARYTGDATKVKGQLDNDATNIALRAKISDLAKTTDGSSGADSIGVTTISGVSGNTVQSVLENLEADKVDKVAGKGLSTNDYDATEKGNVAANTSARHSHSNKALLDTYTQTEANLADAVSSKHSHSNKAFLDTLNSTVLDGKVPTTRTVNGKALSSNIVLNTDDIATTDASRPSQAQQSIGAGIRQNTSVYILESPTYNAAGYYQISFFSSANVSLLTPGSCYSLIRPTGASSPYQTSEYIEVTTITQLPGIPVIYEIEGTRHYVTYAQCTNRFVTAAEKATWNAKVNEPSTEGTSGQVLTTDGNGGRTWTTVQGGGGAATWGSITGTLSNQTDLSNALAKKVETTNDSQSLILGKDSSGFYYLG